jgi:hypothetical protein
MPRGGKREGAGRPRTGDLREVTLAGVHVTRAKLEAWKYEADKRGITLTELVESAVDFECSEQIDIASE